MQLSCHRHFHAELKCTVRIETPCDCTVVLYLEVPFFATAETKRNRGYGRALLEAIEDVARWEMPLYIGFILQAIPCEVKCAVHCWRQCMTLYGVHAFHAKAVPVDANPVPA